MIRWLKDGRGDFREQPVKLYPNHQLLVTRSGHVEDEQAVASFTRSSGKSMAAANRKRFRN